jgi:ABC-2 type transport system ATP-binding protein
MIKVDHVTVKYGDFTAVDDISFEIASGDVVAFLGPNGAGKTTTMRVLTGFMAPTLGDIFIDGMDLFENMKEIKSSLGYLPEKPPLYPDLTVTEYLDFVGTLKGMKRDAALKSRIDEILEMTDLTDRRNTLIRFLSKGLKQRVGIAQSIINSPKVLIMDEPTVGLDPRQVVEIRSLIRRLAKAENRTIILSTHILAEANEICENTIIIKDGHIIAADSIDNLQKSHEEGFWIIMRVARNENDLINKLKANPQVISAQRDNERIIIQARDMIQETIADEAVRLGCGLLELMSKKASLEDVFLKLTN